MSSSAAPPKIIPPILPFPTGMALLKSSAGEVYLRTVSLFICMLLSFIQPGQQLENEQVGEGSHAQICKEVNGHALRSFRSLAVAIISRAAASLICCIRRSRSSAVNSGRCTMMMFSMSAPPFTEVYAALLGRYVFGMRESHSRSSPKKMASLSSRVSPRVTVAA